MSWRLITTPILIVLLAGCSATATSAHIELAQKMCEPNGGLAFMEVELMGAGARRITAHCVNEVIALKTEEKK